MRIQKAFSERVGWVAFVLILLLTVPGSALADHQPGHTGNAGGAATITENTDSDGVPNNVPDAGDNLHPSGKDRSVEPGGSGDQGSSESTPDQNGTGPERDNGGTDKPNGPGGADILDQDRNNGCGNDDDFDDDNEGWCGKQTDRGKPENPGKPEDKEEPDKEKNDEPVGAGKNEDKDVVPPLGIDVGQAGTQPGAGGAPGGVAPGQPGTPPGQVLGEVVVQGVAAGNVLPASEQRGAAAGALAVTGAPLAGVLIAATLLLLVGGVLTRRSRSARSPSHDRT